MDTKRYEKHSRESVFIPAPAMAVFDYVDDHSKYYSHVFKFARALGGRIDLQTDEGHGQVVGSHIRLTGRVFGKSLSLEEVVTKREPPHLKIWETVGTPDFLIIGQYQYSIQIEPKAKGSVLNVSFDFSPPKESGWLRLFFSNIYGRMCAREMVTITRNYFRKLGQRSGGD